jgi:hypothetical protein
MSLREVEIFMNICCWPSPYVHVFDCVVMLGSLFGVSGSRMVSYYISNLHIYVMAGHLSANTIFQRCTLWRLWSVHCFSKNVRAKENLLLGSIGEIRPYRKSDMWKIGVTEVGTVLQRDETVREWQKIRHTRRSVVSKAGLAVSYVTVVNVVSLTNISMAVLTSATLFKFRTAAYSAHMLYLRVSCVAEHKQRLFPQRAKLVPLYWTYTVYCHGMNVICTSS